MNFGCEVFVPAVNNMVAPHVDPVISLWQISLGYEAFLNFGMQGADRGATVSSLYAKRLACICIVIWTHCHIGLSTGSRQRLPGRRKTSYRTVCGRHPSCLAEQR